MATTALNMHESCPHPDFTMCDCTCHGGTMR
jgi:hypothetical protein